MEQAKIKLNEDRKESSMQKDTPYKKACLYKKTKLFLDEKDFCPDLPSAYTVLIVQ